MDLEKLYEFYKSSNGVCTDTRKLQPGQIFFSLKGGNFNGNKYALEAIQKGATLAVIDEPEFKTNESHYFLVNNALEALQELAHYHRKQLKIPVIAITGSNGKTTTKELIKEVLSTTYETIATEGNLNNHIGVPLTVLSIKERHEMAIVEMGANHKTEINQLCKYALPNFGLITNIGTAHLEGFGGPEGVKQAKAELFEFLEAFNGRCFVNMSDYKISEIAYFIQKVTTYGTGKFYNINGKALPSDDFLKVVWFPKKAGKAAPEPEPVIINTQLIGRYNLDNVLAAVAIGVKFKVPKENIKSAIENYSPKNNRSQIVKQESNTIILDAYNANPSSMEAALKNLETNKTKNKVAVLGEMLELGEYSESEHERIADLANQLNLNQLILVGAAFEPFKSKCTHYFEDNKATKEWFEKQHFSDTIILIKGSRGVALEKILKPESDS